MPERIDLVCGSAPWLLRLQTLVLAAAALLLLVAATPPAWKIAALAALLVTHLAALRHTRKNHPPRKLLLRLDGSLRLYDGPAEIEGNADGGAWISPWLCVLRWTARGGARRASLVCASENHRDDYRRLLVLLRLRGPAGQGIRT